MSICERAVHKAPTCTVVSKIKPQIIDLDANVLANFPDDSQNSSNAQIIVAHHHLHDFQQQIKFIHSDGPA